METIEFGNARRKKVNILKIAITLALFTQPLFAQEKIITTMEPTTGSALYAYDGTSARKIFEDSARLFPNHRIMISRPGNLVGVLSSKGSRYDKQGLWYLPSELMIFSIEGKLLQTIPEVQDYVWSPNGKAIVCITGTDIEGFGFKADKLMVIDISSWNQRVLQENVRIQDVFWAEFDSMIYTTDFQTVYQINPKTGVISKTDYKGIYFSPDGNYYFVANYEGGTFGVYDRRTNKDVTPEGYKENPAVNFHRWLPEGSTLVFGDTFREKQVFDAAMRTIRKTVSGQMLGYNKQTKEFIVLKHHRYFPEVPDKKIEKIADH